MGWIFREQIALDVGMDALAEEVATGFATGHLVALVLKVQQEGWVYGGHGDSQLSYWLSYSLPVVFLAYDPDTGLTRWQYLTPDAVDYSGTVWRVRIPAEHVLGPEARRAFTAIAHGVRSSKYWEDAARAVARAEGIAALPVGRPSQENFLQWVGTLVDRFQHAVEHTDIWRIFWNDKLTRPRGELIVHAAAATMWSALCEFAEVDMSRESDAGRGPVDFKFSAGWSRRALIEVKLLSSSKLFQGADAQLPQYLASEQISCAYYVCVGFTDRDLRPARLALVRARCAEYGSRSGHVVVPRFIDARPKLPASRLPRTAGSRADSRGPA